MNWTLRGTRKSSCRNVGQSTAGPRREIGLRMHQNANVVHPPLDGNIERTCVGQKTTHLHDLNAAVRKDA
eukprot:1194075-Prorocentrum_minimum.AAC.1